LDGDYGEYYPEGLYHFLLRLKELGLPIYITENGCPDTDDDLRPRYLVEHLYQIWRALQAGCSVQGYYHWTLVDNFEWVEGWTLPFGLIELDPQTQVRTMRRSGELYGEIVQAGGIPPEIVEQYALELSSQV
jgi:beta-glucosidase